MLGHDHLLGEMLTGLLPVVQTVVAVILGVISKLLRDIRNELWALDKRLAQTEVGARELEKRLVEHVHELRREADILRAQVERQRNDGR